MRRRLCLALVIALTVAPLLSAVQPAMLVHAATITVTTTADDATVNGNCTLREAIQAANTDAAVDACSAGSGSDTINLASGATYTLTTRDSSGQNINGYGVVGLPPITSNVTIEGNGATIQRDGSAPSFRLLVVADSGNLTIRNVTLSGGLARGGNGGAGGTDDAGGGGGGLGAGGAIYARGTLLVENSTLTSNTARGGNGGNSGTSVGAGDFGGGGGGGGMAGNGGTTDNDGGGGGGGFAGDGGRGGLTGAVNVGGGGGGSGANGSNATVSGGPGGALNGGNGGIGNANGTAATGAGGGGGGGGKNSSGSAVGGAGGFGGGGGGGGEDDAGGGGAVAGGNGGAGGFGGGGGGGGEDGNGGAGGFGAGGGGASSDNGISAQTGGAGGFAAGTGGNAGGGTNGSGSHGGGGGGAGLGAAIFVDGSSSVTIRNSTFSGNTAQGGSGGAGFVNTGGGGNGTAGEGRGGAIYNRNGSVTLYAVTVNDNTAANGAAVEGLGDGSSGTLVIQRTIIANSSATPDCRALTVNGGSVSTSGSADNLIESSNNCGGITVNSDPSLAALAVTAPGNTATHALNTGSPAIDAVAGNCPEATDQRGVTRPQDGNNDGAARCDIGAYEGAVVATTTSAAPVIDANNNGSGDKKDKDEKSKKSEQQRYQEQHTNTGSQSDTSIKGYIDSVLPNERPPVVFIQSADGLVRLELTGEALKVLPSLKPGMEIWADGEKVHEQYYIVTDISPSDD